MAAVTAAVATTAIAAGTAAMSAAQKKKAASQAGKAAGGLGETAPPAPGLRERLFSRGTESILNEERSVLEDAAAQGKFLEPELYRALGLEPIYDTEEGPDITGMSAALSGRQEQLGALRSEFAAATNRKRELGLALRRAPAGPAGREERLAIKTEQKQLNAVLRATPRQNKALQREIANLGDQLGQAQAVGRRVVGFRRLDGVADPTGSAGGAFGSALDAYNEHLAAALSGAEPLDPTLKREFDERERGLRERLRRNMGPDYETSSAGIEALRNFDREKAEAFAQYNTERIDTFSKLGESRASILSELTSARLKNLAFVPSFRGSLGEALGGAAKDRQGLMELRQRERLAPFESQEASRRQAAEMRAGAALAEGEAEAELTGAIGGTLAGGLGGASGTLSRLPVTSTGSLRGDVAAAGRSIAGGASRIGRYLVG